MKSSMGGRPGLSLARTRGSVFHRLMELKIKEKWDWPTTYKMLARVTASIRDEFEPGEVSTDELKQVLLELAPVVMRLPKSSFLLHMEGIKKAEKKLRGEMNGHVLVGRTDANGEVPEETYYIDWKLGNAPQSASRQLAFYHLIEPVDAAYTFNPMSGIVKKARLGARRMQDLRGEVLRLIDGIESRDFSKNHKGCSYCYYQEVCKPGYRPSWSQAGRR